MSDLVLVLHNIRSANNVGSMLRTTDGFGANVYICGYTPYPIGKNDSRMPHIAKKVHAQIAKTALGAENSVKISRFDTLSQAVSELKSKGFLVAALEQAPKALPLNHFLPKNKTAIIVGNEVAGLTSKELALADQIIEIPMLGKKESFNVSTAAGIAMYHSRLALNFKNR